MFSLAFFQETVQTFIADLNESCDKLVLKFLKVVSIIYPLSSHQIMDVDLKSKPYFMSANK